MEKKNILEAALFMAPEPLGIDKIARILNINSLGHVKELLEGLQREYQGRGFEVVKTGEGWSLQIRPDILPVVAHLTPYKDLGEGPKRSLALIALKEPANQSEIIKTQGNKAYSYIKALVSRGLVKAEKKGHTKVLHLTQEFERYFGEEKARIKQSLQDSLEGERISTEPVEKALPESGEAHREPGVEEIPESAEKTIITKEREKEKRAEKKTEEEKSRDIKPSHSHAFKEIE